jgi:hypothetical protein
MLPFSVSPLGTPAATPSSSSNTPNSPFYFDHLHGGFSDHLDDRANIVRAAAED